MTEFTPFLSSAGGVLIGVASVLLLLTHGRVAGISGILGGLFHSERTDRSWRLSFLGGLLVSGFVAWLAFPGSFAIDVERSLPLLAVAGLLVGFGTQLGNGCTSGHGVCGIGRMSKRSLVATITFVGAGMVTVFVVNYLARVN